MTAGPGRLRAWIELARLSNAPTVVSNALTGAAIGLSSTGTAPGFGPVVSASSGMVLLYVAGMFLNDAADAAIDRAERPGRPIPSGRISRRAAWIAGAGCLVAGIALCAPAGAASMTLAAILAVAIVIYDLVHSATAASIVLLGLCRALVYLPVAASVHWPVDWWIALPPAVALGSYVVLLSVVARAEALPRPQGRPWLVLPLPLVVIMPAVILWPPRLWVLAVVAQFVLAGWLVATMRDLAARPPRLGRAVGAWLAGICLVDGYYLLVLDRPALACAAAACFVATVIGHRFVKGT